MISLARPCLAVGIVFFGLLLSAGCKRDNGPDTGIIVEVTTDLRVPSDINQVHLTAGDSQGNILHEETFDLGEGPNRVLPPFRVGIYPLHDTATPIHIEAVGQLDTASQPVASRSATLSFIQGKKVVLQLPLLAVCKDVACKVAYSTCQADGKCGSDTVDSKNLPTYVPNQPAPDTTGGTTAGGGTTSAGGTTTTGGTTTSGGTTSSGGTTTTGGTTASGGMTTSGGTTSTGGTTTAGGTTASGGTSGSGGASADGGTPPPSCSGLAATCGPSGTGDCCASLLVPGGAFYRSYDGVTYTNMSYPATVADFYLDKYEITVGRFRQFVNAGMGTQASPPVAGAGVHPGITGSGWDSTWNTNLAADPNSLSTAMSSSSCGSYATWTATAGSDESKPVNCLDWYTAFAFCAWDGGRLPTEAEWNYATSGGNEQRYYPWSSPPTSTTIDDSYAVYCGGSCNGTQNVGSKSPKGDGKWGQCDLAGNVFEWTLDWYDTYYQMPCNNCADITDASASHRVVRGGYFYNGASYLRSAGRYYNYPWEVFVNIGARCARTSL